MKKEEFLSLRNEILQRLDRLQSWNIQLVILITTIWSIAVLLYQQTGVYSSNSENISKEMQILILIVICILFYLPVIISYTMSGKIKDNLVHIAKISSYLIVFYEIPSIHKDAILWETMSGIPTKKKLFNTEYLFLTTIAVVLFILFLIMLIMRVHTFFPLNTHIGPLIITIIACLVLIGITSFLFVGMLKNISIKANVKDVRDTCLNEFKEIALKESLITEAEIKEYDSINIGGKSI